MKASKELDSAIKLLMQMAVFEGDELVRDERIRSALRELKLSRRGDEQDTERLVRALFLISEVAHELLIDIGK